MAKLTSRVRKRLKESQFGTPAEKAKVRRRVRKQYPDIEVHGSGPFSAVDIGRGYRRVG